ncbi:hypothetical protein J0J30_24020, partial [Vibrio vulnificus]|nr:hypothetical protein [Vibrio vulnificus]
SNNLQKILWIGPLKFKSSISIQTNGASKLVQLLNKLSQRNCEIIIAGHIANQLAMMESNSMFSCNMISYASVAWEFLKGKKLHG